MATMGDDRLVKLALERGYVTAEQVERAKVEQKALADRGIDHGLYFLLQDLGMLSEGDARELRRSVSSSAIRALEVDGFIIQGRLGSGGMGDVFRAKHPDGRIAAIKLLSGKLVKNEEYVRRFLREARATQRLNHPHIVRTLSSGESLSTHYMMMELVEGPSLKSWLVERGKFAADHGVFLLRQMASALRYAWDHGILHRDVKPANIMLGPPRPGVAEPFCAKLCDFGLARVEKQPGEEDVSIGGLTGSGLALGTPHYMSPEQASGEHDVDQRADIYGLGATIYHALLGQTLYSGKSSAVIMYKQVTETADLGQLRAAGVQEALVVLVGRMLEKRRAQRIATWAEIEALAAKLSTSTHGSPLVMTKELGATSKPTDSPVAAALAPAPSAPVAVAVAVAPAPPRMLRMVIATAGIITLLVAMVVGIMLSRGSQTVSIDPAGFSAALTALAMQDAQHRVLVLAPGVYAGPWRLGAAHAGLRLRAAGAGVVLHGSRSASALSCEPGFVDASIQGIEIIAGEGQAAVEISQLPPGAE